MQFSFFVTYLHYGQNLQTLSKNYEASFRVSVQGVESLGGHFARLCWGFDFHEVKKEILFFKKKGKYFYIFNHFSSEKSSKRAK